MECLICMHDFPGYADRAPSDAVCAECLIKCSRMLIIRGQWMPVPFDALGLEQKFLKAGNLMVNGPPMRRPR